MTLWSFMYSPRVYVGLASASTHKRASKWTGYSELPSSVNEHVTVCDATQQAGVPSKLYSCIVVAQCSLDRLQIHPNPYLDKEVTEDK